MSKIAMKSTKNKIKNIEKYEKYDILFLQFNFIRVL